MTDELIMRLRSEEVLPCGEDSVNPVRKPTAREIEAADALEAQARRIAELEYDATYHESNDEVMMRDIEYYRARIAELEAALKPFADVANYFDNEPRYTDEDSPCEAFNTFGDLRAARAAYLGEKE